MSLSGSYVSVTEAFFEMKALDVGVRLILSYVGASLVVQGRNL